MICNICIKEIKDTLLVYDKPEHPIYTIKRKRVVISHYEHIKREFIVKKIPVKHCNIDYCKNCLDYFNTQTLSINKCPKCFT